MFTSNPLRKFRFSMPELQPTCLCKRIISGASLVPVPALPNHTRPSRHHKRSSSFETFHAHISPLLIIFCICINWCSGKWNCVLNEIISVVSPQVFKKRLKAFILTTIFLLLIYSLPFIVLHCLCCFLLFGDLYNSLWPVGLTSLPFFTAKKSFQLSHTVTVR